MVKLLLTLFIFLSFITKSIGGIDHSNPILSRLTYSDIFGVLAIMIGFSQLLKGIKTCNRFLSLYTASFILVFFMFLPILFSLNIISTLLENSIIIFLVFISILIFQNYKYKLTGSLFPLIINTTIAASFIGFYDIFAVNIGLPRLFDSRSSGEVISGFRNAGQAGAFFLVFLTILIPLHYSNLKNALSKTYQILLKVALVSSIIFLFSTGKIAAYIGFVFGLFLFLITKRDFKSLFYTSIFVVLISTGFNHLESVTPDFHNRINRKIESRIIQNYNGESENKFIQNNFNGALQAFYDNPISGSGMGAFYGNYGRYEVHSTYFKILGEGGLIVTLPYIIFVLVFLKIFPKIKTTNNPYLIYLKFMFPFILGCMISWGYTYHLRKREFWILISVIAIVKFNALIWSKYNDNKRINIQ
jgi:hypothetical protein